MDRTQALAVLADMVQAGTPPVLNDADLNRFLDASRVIDSEDRPPTDPEYVETFDLNYAAALAFEAKADLEAMSDTSNLESFTSEGTTFKRRANARYNSFMNLASKYRARSVVGDGGISVINLEPEGGMIPRSAGYRDADT